MGVECSYKYKEPIRQSDPTSENIRAKLYKINDVEEEAKYDVLKVTQSTIHNPHLFNESKQDRFQDSVGYDKPPFPILNLSDSNRSVSKTRIEEEKYNIVDQKIIDHIDDNKESEGSSSQHDQEAPRRSLNPLFSTSKVFDFRNNKTREVLHRLNGHISDSLANSSPEEESKKTLRKSSLDSITTVKESSINLNTPTKNDVLFDKRKSSSRKRYNSTSLVDIEMIDLEF